MEEILYGNRHQQKGDMTYKELDEILEHHGEKQVNEFQLDRTLHGLRLRKLGGAKSSPLKLSESLPLDYKKATDNHYVDRHFITSPQGKHNRRCLNDPPWPVSSSQKKKRMWAKTHGEVEAGAPLVNSGHPLTGHGPGTGQGPHGVNIRAHFNFGGA